MLDLDKAAPIRVRQELERFRDREFSLQQWLSSS
jgi:hypothetical protein